MGISREQALDCLRSEDLLGIGMEADAVRRRLHPEGVVTYAVACAIDCAALAGAETEGGWEAARTAAGGVVEQAVESGATGVSLQGAAPVELLRMEQLLKGWTRRFPGMWVHGLGAGAVVGMSRACGVRVAETLGRLREAGLGSLAGEDAGILGSETADSAAADQSFLNGSAGRGCTAAEWLEVHRAAHGLGMPTTAGMTFGAGETAAQRVDHLEALRRLQEETGGFRAFVPVRFAPRTPGARELDGPTAVESLKLMAVGRMVLDGIEHVEAGSAVRGLKVLQTALRFGGDDAGPVAEPAANGAGVEELRRVVRDAGFQPVERDLPYRTTFLR